MADFRALPTLDIPNLIGQGFSAFKNVKDIQQNQANFDKRKLIEELSQGAQTDPKKLAQLVTLDPKRAQAIQQFNQSKVQAKQETQTRFEKERAFIAKKIEGRSLKEQLGTIDRQIQLIIDREEDPSTTQEIRNLLVGNPDQNAQAQVIIRNAVMLGEQQGFLKPVETESRTSLAKNIELLRDPNLTPEQRKIVLANLAGSQQRVEINPDGSIVFSSGKGLDASGLQKKTKGKLESKLVTFEENILDLNRIEEQFKPGFLTFLGKGKAFLTSLKSKAGINLSPEEKQFSQNRRAFIQNINRFFNGYRKEITGAAASVQELGGLKKSIFNEDLSPVEFEAAFKEFKDGILRSRRLVRKLNREGVSGSLKDKKSQAAKRFDAEFTAGGDDSVEDRIQDLQSQGIEKEEMFKILSDEGYN